MQSLGQDLFEFDRTKDYLLVIQEGEQGANPDTNVLVHGDVLRVSSPFFMRMLGGQHLHGYRWFIPQGYREAALCLLRYMYTRNLDDLWDHVQTKYLALKLEMNRLYHVLTQATTLMLYKIHHTEVLAEQLDE